MKFLKKLKSSNFWVSMISAVILILQAVFNVDIKTEYLTQIILGILGLLVMSGIVTDTDTNSREMTVKQSLDAESIKDTINTMLTQIGATLQMDITKIVSQFDNTTQTKITENETENFSTKNTNSIIANTLDGQIQNVQQLIETKIENSAEQKQDKIVEEETQEQIIPVQQQISIQEIQAQSIIDNAPKNEL